MDATEDEDKRPAQGALAEAMEREGLFPGSIFQHYKGGFYTVVSASVMQGTWETVVTYRSNRFGTLWTHTLAEFTKLVPLKPSGVLVPRFRRVYD